MATTIPNAETDDRGIRELERQIEVMARRLEGLKLERSGAALPVDNDQPRQPEHARDQRALRVGVLSYLSNYGPLIILTAPIIYATFVPLLFLDLSLTIYQWLCFPIYGIEKARRRDFIVIDRHQLSYLNFLEKLNCAFCEYATGVLAYSVEIGSRTEEFWCPIKHQRQPANEHMRACDFASFSDGVGYRVKQRQNGKQAKAAARRMRACHSCSKSKE